MLFREKFLVELVIADYVDRFALGEERRFLTRVSFAKDAIGELEDGAAQHRGPGLNEDLIVVAGRGAIAAADIDHRQDALVFSLQKTVRES